MSLTIEEVCRPVHSIRHGPRPTVLWFPDRAKPAGPEADKAPISSLGIVTAPGNVGLWQKTTVGWMEIPAQRLV